MADEAQVAMLKRSVEDWNQWRTTFAPFTWATGYPFREPETKHIDLSGAELDRLDLTGAVLSDAVLCKADLRRCRLTHADFRGADLRGAKFQYANLYAASFGVSRYRPGAPPYGFDLPSYTDLRGASFRDAHLSDVFFSDAVMEGTDFTGAILGGTALVRVNLAEVRGLETCVHSSPSIIDMQTLLASPGLPVEFLRGCGLPDRLIAFLPSLWDERSFNGAEL